MAYITAYSECCLDTLACCDLFTERTRRPGAELLTPVPGGPILGLNIQGVRIATISGEYVSVRYVDVFAEAVMQLAQDIQPADSRNRGEINLNLVMGQMICFRVIHSIFEDRLWRNVICIFVLSRILYLGRESLEMAKTQPLFRNWNLRHRNQHRQRN